MGNPKAKSWITGTAVIAIALLVGAWFLLIAPVREATAETTAEAVSQDDRNAREKKQIEALAAQFADIETYRAQLADLRQQIPTSPRQGEFQSQIAAIAVTHSVTIASLTITPSTEVVVAGPATASAQDAEESAGDEAAPAPAPANLFAGFYQMPITIEVVGTYQNVLSFMGELQTINPRAFLITGLAGTGQKQADGSGGLPPTAPGDLNLVISGQMYVLADPNAVPDAIDPGSISPLPVPPHEKNPLFPAAGS